MAGECSACGNTLPSQAEVQIGHADPMVCQFCRQDQRQERINTSGVDLGPVEENPESKWTEAEWAAWDRSEERERRRLFKERRRWMLAEYGEEDQ